MRLGFFLVILAVINLNAADADRPTIPDPYGMGYRLALIDFLHARKISIPEDATESQLLAIYRKKFSPNQTTLTPPDVKQEQQERISQIRHKLHAEHHFDAAESTSLSDLEAMLVQAEMTARRRERERSGRLVLADILRRYPELAEARSEIAALITDPRPWPDEAITLVDKLSSFDGMSDAKAHAKRKTDVAPVQSQNSGLVQSQNSGLVLSDRP